MSNERIKQLLADLQDEVNRAGDLDPETMEQVKALDEDLSRWVDSKSEGVELDSPEDTATALEARFAVNHPVAEGIIRDILEALGKIGI